MTLAADSTPQALPEQIRWELLGNKEQADTLRGLGFQLMGQMKLENVNDYDQYYKRVDYKDGTKILVQRQKQIFVDLYTISIFYPQYQDVKKENKQVEVEKPKEDQFYWIPKCVARYDGLNNFQNCIPSGDLKDSKVMAVASDDSLTSDTVVSRKKSGLPSISPSPGGYITKDYAVVVMPGNTTETISDNVDSGLSFDVGIIPGNTSFSISCVVKLHKNIEVDNSFSERTTQLNNGYTVYNPIKARLLESSNGIDWYFACPGSIAPLLASVIPSRFSSHYASFTYPWPDYNNNFATHTSSAIGYRELDTLCDNDSVLSTQYSLASPYWDKITQGSIEYLSGEFIDFWEEDTDVQNTAPYTSYCKFKISGDHQKSVGTRVVGTTSSGEKRYGIVSSCECEYYEGIITATKLTIKDYQYKLYVKDSAQTLAFGDQSFPYSHPKGYIIGVNLSGLCWYDGNRILAGRICDFEKEYLYKPIISDPIDLNVFYHVCMTYDITDGETSLYITRIGKYKTIIYGGSQSVGQYYSIDGHGKSVKYKSGSGQWHLSAEEESPMEDWKSSWIYTAAMSMGLMRFYHRALSKEEALLLASEAKLGTFVADDFEAAKLVGLGYKPIMV